MSNVFEKSNPRGIIVPLVTLIILAIIGTSVFCLPQKAYADEPTIIETHSLYFGEGSRGWTLYSDPSLTNEYYSAVAEGHWEASGNTLILTDFNFTAQDKTHALVLTESCTVELFGDNSFHVIKTDADALCLHVSGDVAIKGSGTLTLTTSDTSGRASAIVIDKPYTTLTFSEATVTAKAGNAEAYSYGIECTSNSGIVIENGGHVFASGSNTTGKYGGENGYGALFRQSADSTRVPLVVTGKNSSFIGQGSSCSLKAGTEEPQLDEKYGVYASRSYVNSEFENGWYNSKWNKLFGCYIVPDTDNKESRYLWIAEKPTITTSELPYGVINEPYRFEVTATGEGTPFFWSAPPGTGSAAGLKLNQNDIGILSGTPTELGEGSIRVYVSSTLGSTVQEFSFSVYSRAEIHADATQNGITKNAGLSGSGTKTDPYLTKANTTFSLTAFGDLEAMDAEVPGDTRFVPTDWNINSSTLFNGSPYIINCKLSEPGTYTLSVNFQEEVWTGTTWEPTGTVDTKTAMVAVQENPDKDDDSDDSDDSDNGNDSNDNESGGNDNNGGGGNDNSGNNADDENKDNNNRGVNDDSDKLENIDSDNNDSKTLGGSLSKTGDHHVGLWIAALVLLLVISFVGSLALLRKK